jgi:hypothetical protein
LTAPPGVCATATCATATRATANAATAAVALIAVAPLAAFLGGVGHRIFDDAFAHFPGFVQPALARR